MDQGLVFSKEGIAPICYEEEEGVEPKGIVVDLLVCLHSNP